jgi:hypothetical protein
MVRPRHPFFSLRSGTASARHLPSRLCRCGSSDPLFSPLCVRRLPRSGRDSSASSSLPPSSTFPNPRFVIPPALSATEGNAVAKGSDPVGRNLLIPPLLSQRAHESKTGANNYFIFNSIQTRISATHVESWLYKSRGGVFHTLPSACKSQSRTTAPVPPPTFTDAQMNRGPIEP